MSTYVDMKDIIDENISSFSTDYSDISWELKVIVLLVVTAAEMFEEWRISMALWGLKQVREDLNVSILYSFLSSYLVRGSEIHTRLISFLPKEDRHDIEVDKETLAPANFQNIPELEIFCTLVVLIFLVDQKKYIEAKSCACDCVSQLDNLKWRTIDVLSSRIYFYYSLTYELTGDLAEIRRKLFLLYSAATLCRNGRCQETLGNLLFRNYLNYKLYDQAAKLMRPASWYETHSYKQLSRSQFYRGKIKMIRLEYSDAECLLVEAAYRAPPSAIGFQVQCKKWTIIVFLLLGQIPERALFVQKRMEKALRPYFELTKAVRSGDLELFRTVANKFANIFKTDGTHNLILRLRPSVIRAGLRNISISYSRISFVDIAQKLHLNSANIVADAESIIAKAIRDGAIDCILDHANGYMVSRETEDIYSTNKPQIAFTSRIQSCLETYNENVRKLRYPPSFSR